jgi:hypothetical protein
MKKLMIAVLLISSLLTNGQAFAATTSVQPPVGVGTYVDFYHDVRLQWKPVVGAVAYKVYLADGYNAKSGFVLQHTLTNYTLRYINRQYRIYDYVSTPKIQWYTIRVISVDKNGKESVPFTTSVNVWR